MSYLRELNKTQRECVEDVEHHLLILAGAGAGKTRVITSKFIHLIEKHQYNPYSILAITFTNKATSEMRERIHQYFSSKYPSLKIQTFHSFSAWLLRRFVHKIPPYSSNFTVIDDDDQMKILKEITKEVTGESEDWKAFKSCILQLKNEMIGPDGDISPYWFIHDIDLEELKKVYTHYRNYLLSHNLVDFDDLLILCAKILTQDVEVQTFIKRHIRYLLVDEYQDTNKIQECILAQFISQGIRLTVVGDEDQSIYSFRHATIENILNFPKRYSNVKIMKLEENYRSTPSILSLANTVIQNNVESYHKILHTKKKKEKKLT